MQKVCSMFRTLIVVFDKIILICNQTLAVTTRLQFYYHSTDSACKHSIW